ncbi:MAG: hypothetical protein JNM24_00820 [Bdellovibrionaceae bacterium]|nr:hypothetical protein [Pseudobdellovibrionaceae bacterium]
MSAKSGYVHFARNPFLAVSFENRYFKDEADYWLIDAETRFSPGHLVKSKATVKEFTTQFKNLAVDHILIRPQHRLTFV